METLGLGVDGNLDTSTVSRGSLEVVLARVEATRGELLAGGIAEPEGLAVAPVRVSVTGLKVRSPAKTMAVTISGEATKAWVAGLASLRPVKLRL